MGGPLPKRSRVSSPLATSSGFDAGQAAATFRRRGRPALPADADTLQRSPSKHRMIPAPGPRLQAFGTAAGRHSLSPLKRPRVDPRGRAPPVVIRTYQADAQTGQPMTGGGIEREHKRVKRAHDNLQRAYLSNQALLREKEAEIERLRSPMKAPSPVGAARRSGGSSASSGDGDGASSSSSGDGAVSSPRVGQREQGGSASGIEQRRAGVQHRPQQPESKIARSVAAIDNRMISGSEVVRDRLPPFTPSPRGAAPPPRSGAPVGVLKTGGKTQARTSEDSSPTKTVSFGCEQELEIPARGEEKQKIDVAL